MTEDRFETPRTLPWRESDGRRAYVIADPDRPGLVSGLADATERVQLEMAEGLLAHAQALVDEAGARELRHLVTELSRALTETLLIARRVRH